MPHEFVSFDSYADAQHGRNLLASLRPSFTDTLGATQSGGIDGMSGYPRESSKFVGGPAVEHWKASDETEALLAQLEDSRRQARMWRQEADTNRLMALSAAQRLRDIRDKAQQVDEAGSTEGTVEHLRLQLSKAASMKVVSDRKIEENNKEIAALRADVERLELEASKFASTKTLLEAEIERQQQQLTRARVQLSRAQGGLINVLDAEQAEEAALGMASAASAESEAQKDQRIRLLQGQCLKLQNSVQYWKNQNESAERQVGDLSKKVSTLYRTMDLQEVRHVEEMRAGERREWWRGEPEDVIQLREDLVAAQAQVAQKTQAQALAEARAKRGH